MKFFPIILLSAFVFPSCTPTSQLTESDKVTIIKEVKQTLDNYYADVKKSGLTAEFKYLDSSADFSWAPPGFSSPISYDSVAIILRQNAPKFKSINNHFDTLQITPLTPEIAMYSGRLNSEMTDLSGITVSFSLVETGVMIKRPSGWKLVKGQTTLLNNK